MDSRKLVSPSRPPTTDIRNAMTVKTASAIGAFQLRTTAVSSMIGADDGTPASSCRP